MASQTTTIGTATSLTSKRREYVIQELPPIAQLPTLASRIALRHPTNHKDLDLLEVTRSLSNSYCTLLCNLDRYRSHDQSTGKVIPIYKGAQDRYGLRVMFNCPPCAVHYRCTNGLVGRPCQNRRICPFCFGRRIDGIWKQSTRSLERRESLYRPDLSFVVSNHHINPIHVSDGPISKLYTSVRAMRIRIMKDHNALGGIFNLKVNFLPDNKIEPVLGCLFIADLKNFVKPAYARVYDKVSPKHLAVRIGKFLKYPHYLHTLPIEQLVAYLNVVHKNKTYRDVERLGIIRGQQDDAV